MKEVKINKVVIIIIGIIIGFPYIFMLAISSEGNNLKNKAVSYFANKYNVKKSKIKVVENNLNSGISITGVPKNRYIRIKYSNKNYVLEYDTGNFTCEYEGEEDITCEEAIKKVN